MRRWDGQHGHLGQLVQLGQFGQRDWYVHEVVCFASMLEHFGAIVVFSLRHSRR